MDPETQRALGLTTRLLSEPPDLAVVADPESWALVRKYAKQFGVAPLVAHIARLHVPRSDKEWCDGILTRSWTLHENSLYHLKFVLGLLSDAGIETICLKGPLLARRYYNPPFLRRPSADLDIAVRESDLRRACEALVSAGYAREVSDAEAFACSHHVTLTHPARLHVELHFRSQSWAPGHSGGRVLRQVEPCEFPGGTARVLGPEDEALQLLLHVAHDRFKPIFHLYEMHKVWSTTSLEVRSAVISRAAGHHLQGVVGLTDVAFRARWGDPFLPPGSPRKGPGCIGTTTRGSMPPLKIRPWRGGAHPGGSDQRPLAPISDHRPAHRRGPVAGRARAHRLVSDPLSRIAHDQNVR